MRDLCHNNNEISSLLRGTVSKIGFEVVCKLDNAKVGLIFGLTKCLFDFFRQYLLKYTLTLPLRIRNMATI